MKQKLEALVNKVVDANRYAQEVEAQTTLFHRQKETGAQKFEKRKLLLAKANAKMDASLAVDEAIKAKADAMKLYDEVATF